MLVLGIHPLKMLFSIHNIPLLFVALLGDVYEMLIYLLRMYYRAHNIYRLQRVLKLFYVFLQAFVNFLET